ncbi:hypothetical protein GCM10027186_30320 [Micromonospora schwarzwaldensis]
MARLRRRFPYDKPPGPKSELMARLRALYELGRGRRGYGERCPRTRPREGASTEG